MGLENFGSHKKSVNQTSEGNPHSEHVDAEVHAGESMSPQEGSPAGNGWTVLTEKDFIDAGIIQPKELGLGYQLQQRKGEILDHSKFSKLSPFSSGERAHKAPDKQPPQEGVEPKRETTSPTLSLPEQANLIQAIRNGEMLGKVSPDNVDFLVQLSDLNNKLGPTLQGAANSRLVLLARTGKIPPEKLEDLARPNTELVLSPGLRLTANSALVTWVREGAFSETYFRKLVEYAALDKTESGFPSPGLNSTANAKLVEFVRKGSASSELLQKFIDGPFSPGLKFTAQAALQRASRKPAK